MKPARFEYDAPRSIDDALAVIARCDGEARLLAGGQSLIPLMNFRLASPARVVDLNGIAELDYLRLEGDQVRIGAMTRQRRIEFSALVAERLPLLRDAVRLVGHLPTRTRGTVGGSLAHADPAAEIPMALLALEAEIMARSPRGGRSIRIADFFRSALTTALAADEILTEVRVPVPPVATGHAVEEFARRHGDFAIAAVAATVLTEGEQCTRARLSVAGAGPAPMRVRVAEALLEAEGLSERTITRASELAAGAVEPMTDQLASAEFRRHLTRVLARRALDRAAAMARGKSPG